MKAGNKASRSPGRPSGRTVPFIVAAGVIFLLPVSLMEEAAEKILGKLGRLPRNDLTSRIGFFLFQRGVLAIVMALIWVPAKLFRGMIELSGNILDEIQQGSGLASLGWSVYLVYFVLVFLFIILYISLLFLLGGTFTIVMSAKLRGMGLTLKNVAVDFLYVLVFWLLNVSFMQGNTLTKGIYSGLSGLFFLISLVSAFRQSGETQGK